MRKALFMTQYQNRKLVLFSTISISDISYDLHSTKQEITSFELEQNRITKPTAVNNNIDTQSMNPVNANQVTDSSAVRGFAEINIQINIPKNHEKKDWLCSCNFKSSTISEFRQNYLSKIKYQVNFKMFC